MHVFGQPADMDPILDDRRAPRAGRDRGRLRGDRRDATRDRAVGTLGDAGVFAFYPNKQMTTGEGGMIVTDDAAWDALFRSLRNQGRDVFDGWLDAHAARLQLPPRRDERRAGPGADGAPRRDTRPSARASPRWYDDAPPRLEGVDRPAVAPWTTRMSWFVYVIRLARGATATA